MLKTPTLSLQMLSQKCRSLSRASNAFLQDVCVAGFEAFFSIHLLMLQMMVAKEIKMVNDECGFSPQSREHEISLQTI